ncbi:MAG: hypothetical protein DWQ05_22345 [Calditrichaeota bacterium]|nr:MAG: hypothetical protein DWQ05_22345 [Calditrichota bacterium]
MTYHQAAHQILQREQKSMELPIVAEMAFDEGLVKPRKSGMSRDNRIRSFVETVKRNIRDIFNNEPKLIHPNDNLNLIALPEKVEEPKTLDLQELEKEETIPIASDAHEIKQDELHKAIGKVSNYFSGLETYISSLIWILIGAGKDVGEIITSELSFHRLTALLRCLFLYRKSDSAEIERMDSILKRANDIEQRRNKVIHSLWAVNSQNDELLRVKTTAKYKTGLKYHFDRTNMEELQKLTDDIVYVISDISQILIAELNAQNKEK